MELVTLENYQISAGQELVCDIFIYFLCSEPRSKFIISEYSIKSDRQLKIQVESGRFEVFEYDEILSGGIISLERCIDEIKTNTKIILDISCMPREVMSSFLAFLAERKGKTVEVVVLYALANFSEPRLESYVNEAIEPVHEKFAGWSPPDTKPTSLVLGLGYEPDKAAGASEYFEPSDQWVFVPSSPIKEFQGKVRENNASLLSEMERQRVVEYDVFNPELTYGQLEMVVGLLVKKSNPIMLPFGPKIFFFLCLINCLSHPELGVWSFSSKQEYESNKDVCASGMSIGVRCVFKQSVEDVS